MSLYIPYSRTHVFPGDTDICLRYTSHIAKTCINTRGLSECELGGRKTRPPKVIRARHGHVVSASICEEN
eukprot:5694175-Pyramimonas_sp.AAC.1